jgi:Spy/CpxP family protein refolding chaperone
MTKELGLSENQKAKIGAIFDEQKMKFKGYMRKNERVYKAY